MRKFLYIVTAILCYVTLCSKSCNEGGQNGELQQEEKLINEKAEIKSEFASGRILEKSLEAFEMKAVQKLTDLSDYLNILADSSIDNSFREQSRLMTMNLFISDTIRVNRRLLFERDKSSVRIYDFINSEVPIVSKNIAFDSIRVTEQLHFTSDYSYRGRLAFSRRIRSVTNKDTIWSPSAPMQVEFFVSKIGKSFGNEVLKVWNLSFGTIY